VSVDCFGSVSLELKIGFDKLNRRWLMANFVRSRNQQPNSNGARLLLIAGFIRCRAMAEQLRFARITVKKNLSYKHSPYIVLDSMGQTLSSTYAGGSWARETVIGRATAKGRCKRGGGI
jgi:hypothetical protein